MATTATTAPTGQMAEKMMEALRASEKNTSKKSCKNDKSKKPGKLPDLNALAMPEAIPDEEEIARGAEEARRSREYAESAAEMVLERRAKIELITAVEGWELCAELSEAKRQLESQIATIMDAGGNESLTAHIEFCIFLSEIRECRDHDKRAEIFRRLIGEPVYSMEEGGKAVLPRYRVASQKDVYAIREHQRTNDGVWPIGVFKDDKERFCVPNDNPCGPKTAGQKALECAIKTMQTRFSKMTKEKRQKKVEKLLVEPGYSEKLTDLLGMVPGKYRLHQKRHRYADKRGNSHLMNEGVALVELVDINRNKAGQGAKWVVKIIDGAGAFARLAESEYAGFYIPLWCAVNSRISANTPTDIRERALTVAKLLGHVLWPVYCEMGQPRI